MSSKIKLKFTCFWSSPEATNKRMIHNWGVPPECFELTAGDDFDYLVTLCHGEEMLTTAKEKNILVGMEASWSLNSRGSLATMCKLVVTPDETVKGSNVVHRHPFMFNEDSRNDQQSHFVNGPSPTEYLSNIDFHPKVDNKFYKKKLSFFVANHYALAGAPQHPDSNYLIKEKLLKKILESDLNCDIYGRGWDIQDSRYKGAPALKVDGLRDYKYSIAIDNAREKYYLSEKLFDCFLNNCVPIYYGCSTAHEAYDSRSFAIFFPEREDVIGELEKHISFPAEPYHKYVLESKRKYYTEHNLFIFLMEKLT
jgi:hypothetical protein